MDKIKNYIIFSLIILILLGVCTLFGYLYYKEKNKPSNTIISTQTVTQIDTIRYKDTIYNLKPVEVIKPIYDSIIDTVFVINDYYTGKIFEYGFKDTNICFKAGIMLHKNTIVSLIPEYEIYRKTTTITNTIIQPAPELMALVGGGIDYNNGLGLQLTAGIYYKKNIISVYYNPILNGYGIVYKRAIMIK